MRLYIKSYTIHTEKGNLYIIILKHLYTCLIQNLIINQFVPAIAVEVPLTDTIESQTLSHIHSNIQPVHVTFLLCHKLPQVVFMVRRKSALYELLDCERNFLFGC